MRYGHFDDERREYVINRPDTPLPWINYLGSERYFGIISNTAGGYSFYRDARMRRLTRYRYNNVPADSGGRYVYLADRDTGRFWSPTWQPTRTELHDYRCRHGLGYTIIGGHRDGIEGEITYLVPLGTDLEAWRIRLTNHRDTRARISAFPVVEFALWDAWDDQTNFQRNFNTGEVVVDGSTIFHVTEYRERRNHFASFSTSVEPAGFDTDRDAFLGPYRGWDKPLRVARGTMRNSVAHGWAPIGAFQIDVDLGAGEVRDVVITLGYHENPEDRKFIAPGKIDLAQAREVIAEHQDPGAVDAALGELRRHWDGLLGVLTVATPDEHTDRMVNIWNAAQCMATFNLSRSASLFESGVGRGMGFRDSNQDLLGFVHMAPERSRERLLDLAATQLDSGGAFHQYQPLTKQGNDAVGSGFNDDPLWLVLAVDAYVAETGDVSILDEQAVFENRAGSAAPMWEHLRRAVGYTLDRLGPHGLPLIGRADWNDCLNLNTFSSEPGESFQTHQSGDGLVAESVFIAGLFVLAGRRMAALARFMGHDGEAAELDESVAAMTAAVDAAGWDGEWFLRAYDAHGTALGTRDAPEGQIFLEPQGMCVMAGIGVEDGRAAAALDAVEDRLDSAHGIALVRPPFTSYRLELGEISSYPPGYKENGGIFCHTNPWAMIAAAILGEGDRAFEWYWKINPSAREAISGVHRSEPYVYAQMIAGPDAPTHGEAKNSWLTGTAAWNYVAITQWILGIRPDHGGLIVDPVIPSSWTGYRARRRYRGAEYEITVRRSSTETPGIVVNGTPVDGTTLPIAAEGTTVTVDVVLPPDRGEE